MEWLKLKWSEMEQMKWNELMMVWPDAESWCENENEKLVVDRKVREGIMS